MEKELLNRNLYRQIKSMDKNELRVIVPSALFFADISAAHTVIFAAMCRDMFIFPAA